MGSQFSSASALESIPLLLSCAQGVILLCKQARGEVNPKLSLHMKRV